MSVVIEQSQTKKHFTLLESPEENFYHFDQLVDGQRIEESPRSQ